MHEIQFETVCEIFFKLKFSKFIQENRTLESFGKFLPIVLFKFFVAYVFRISEIYEPE